MIYHSANNNLTCNGPQILPKIKHSFIYLKINFFPVSVLLFVFLFISCGSKKKTLFTLLSQQETGIDFINKNEDTDSLNILDYLYYYNGAGVAIGDINNDGLADIYFVANQDGNKLYLNKGNLKFEDITEKAGVRGNADWSTGVAMVDINGDGWLDIYVCTVANHTPAAENNQVKYSYFKNSRNQLFINNGNNTFTEKAKAWGIDIQGYNTQAAFVDYDKDGDLDMFLLQHSVHQTGYYGDTSFRSTHSTVSGGKLFRNEGDHFTDVTTGSGIISSALGYGLGIGIGDMNHDGFDDIYISNDFHENDYYYVNQRNGTFKEMNREAFGHESKFSMGNDIADINNDGWLDIITLDMLPEDEKILKSSQGDETLDNYNTKIDFGYYYQYSRNCLQLNVGKGKRFSDVALYSGVQATDWSWSALIADYDLDGTNDIFVSNGIKNRLNDLDYIKFISNSQIRKQSLNSRKYDKEILKHQPPGAWHNYIFKGGPELKFVDKSLDWGFEKANLSQGAAYADLDNDGDPDLVTNNMNEIAGIYQNNANPGQSDFHYLSIQLKGKAPNTFAVGTKVFVFANEKIHYQELQTVRGFMSSVEPLLNLGLGESKKIDSIIIIWPNDRYQKLVQVSTNTKVLVEYDRDKTDTLFSQFDFINSLLQSSDSSHFVNISGDVGVDFRHRENLSFNDFNNQWFIPHQISTMGPRLAIGDVNGDALEDFFVCGAKNQAGKLFVQQPGGKFKSAEEEIFAIDSACEDVDALFFDADNDRDQDLYVVSGGNEYSGTNEALKDRLYINVGLGHFKKTQTLPAMYQDKSVVKAADFNGDGWLDLFVGGRVNSKSYGEIPTSFLLQNDGKGNFIQVAETAAKGLSKIGMVTDACWTDINKDGMPDLVVVGEWMPVTIFMNDKGRLEKQNSDLDKLTGWWCSIKSGDVNGDGYEDLLVGNYGLNSKLRASEKFPLKMYMSDFDNNQNPDQILSVEKNKEYYPFLGKEDLEKQLPYLRREYLKYGEMADKTVKQIFGNKLNEAKLFEANTFESMVLMNDRKSSFVIKPLPYQLQLTPVFSFLLDDFDLNGQADVLAGGNFFGVTPYEGRYDAMNPAVAWGDGIGNFRCDYQSPDPLLIPGEIRDIKKIRIGQQNCLILALNNEQLVFLKYQ